MNTVFTKFKYLFLRALAFFPTPLPVGMTAFKQWSDQIIDIYGLPDNDSGRWVLAVLVINLEGPKNKPAYYIPKRYFGLAGRKAMANEVASATMKELKEKQDAERKAAVEQSAEATAKLSVVSDGQSVQQ